MGGRYLPRSEVQRSALRFASMGDLHVAALVIWTEGVRRFTPTGFYSAGAIR
jgi:hypothetical protein